MSGTLTTINTPLTGAAGTAGVGGDATITMAGELERHDVLLAEGLPAEPYFDTGDRCNFENCEGAVALDPDFSESRRDAAHIWEALACAPLVVTGPQLDAARALVFRCAERGGDLGAAVLSG